MSSENKKILFLTDVHLDILYNSETSNQGEFTMKCKNSSDYLNHTNKPFDYGRYDCNPSEVLLNTTLKNIENKFPDLDLIILGGDLISHALYDIAIDVKSKLINKSLFKETFNKILNSIREKFPKVKILPIVGNNDFYEHYQTPDEDSKKEQIEFLKNLYFDKNKSNLKNENFNTNLNETIKNGMYYSYFDENLGIKFITLNSNMFSKKNLKINQKESMQQLDFLEEELKRSKIQNEQVFIMMHIPPYPMIIQNEPEFFYLDSFSKRLEEIVFNYRENIINTLCGHLHWSKNGVRLRLPEYNMNFLQDNNYSKKRYKSTIRTKGNSIKFFSLINFPGLTPLHYNNPGYSIIHFNNKIKRISNIETHYADLQKTLDHSRNNEFSLNLEIHPDLLFDIVFNFKNDLKFSQFDDEDFYDFIYNRLDSTDIFKTYQIYISGYNKSANYQSYLEFLKVKGVMDFENNFKVFKCSHKMLYQSELEKC